MSTSTGHKTVDCEVIFPGFWKTGRKGNPRPLLLSSSHRVRVYHDRLVSTTSDPVLVLTRRGQGVGEFLVRL